MIKGAPKGIPRLTSTIWAMTENEGIEALKKKAVELKTKSKDLEAVIEKFKKGKAEGKTGEATKATKSKTITVELEAGIENKTDEEIATAVKSFIAEKNKREKAEEYVAKIKALGYQSVTIE